MSLCERAFGVAILIGDFSADALTGKGCVVNCLCHNFVSFCFGVFFHSGREEFYETLRYFNKQLSLTGVDVKLNKQVSAEDLKEFDAIVLCTGVVPRQVKIPQSGSKRVNCVSYIDVLRHGAVVGERVAVIGAGGIGFDVADFLTHPHEAKQGDARVSGAPRDAVDAEAVQSFLTEWGVDASVRGGLAQSGESGSSAKSARQVYLLQRKEGKLGAGLGKTTGWVHRATMKRREVREMDGCKYLEVTDEGLVIERKGKKQTVPVDTVVFCAGQEPLRDLQDGCNKLGKKVFTIGGAFEAGELDAKRAIDQGTRLAAVIEDAPSGAVYDAPVGMVHKVGKYFKFF